MQAGEERIRLTMSYTDGGSESFYPMLHPDVGVQVQLRELKRWLIDRLMAPEPRALTLEMWDGEQGSYSATFLPRHLRNFRMQVVRVSARQSSAEETYVVQPPHRRPDATRASLDPTRPG